MTRNPKYLAYGLVIITSLLATFSFYFWQVVNNANINLDAEEPAVVYIPKGANYQTVLDSLNKQKLIYDQISFGFLSKFMKYREKVKPGRYVIAANSSNKEVISMLRAGAQKEVKVTFNNIRLKEELAARLVVNLSINSDTLLARLKDEAYCAQLGFTTETIMCMFLPDTYFMWWTIDTDGFLTRMKQEYDIFWTEERKKLAFDTGMSPVEVSVMASIVQSETIKNDEQAKVAGLYVNRIKGGIPLQADPTVKFAVGDFTLRRVLNKHLRVDSPYNTYRHRGLPPGPIALAEKNAIAAVLNFEKHKYLYMCAKEDFSGYHNFASNLTEHNANARRLHRALNQKGIY